MSFSAVGTFVPPLDCVNSYWGKVNWTVGETYLIGQAQCDPVTLEVKPYELKIVP